MRIGNGFSWPTLVLLMLFAFLLFFLEVLLFQWCLGLFGLHFGFWTVAGIIVVIDIIAAKFRGK